MFRIVRMENEQEFYLSDYNSYLKFHPSHHKSWKKWKKRETADKVLKHIQDTYNVQDAYVEEFEPNQSHESKASSTGTKNTSIDDENPSNDSWWADYNQLCKKCAKMCKQSSKVTFVVQCPQFTPETSEVVEGEAAEE